MGEIGSKQTPCGGEEAVILEGGCVLAPTGDRWLERVEVGIEGSRIRHIGSGRDGSPPVARREEISGLFVIPGLIDLHTHLLLRPYVDASWDDQVLRESLELRVVRGVVGARATLEAGFTTIREMGTEGAAFADVALRDAIAGGLVPGPRILASTRAIVATGCYGPSGFDPRWSVPKGAEEADEVAGVRRAVRRQLAAGADWIKVYADGRRSRGAPATPSFSQDELNALVDEARAGGRPVAAHATTNEGVRRAVLAEVTTIEHGHGATREVLELARQGGVAICPTLAAWEAMVRLSGWGPAQTLPPALQDVKDFLARARDTGVTIACGSDAGVFPHGENAREIELMAEYGLGPVDALKAATITAASVLQREDLGSIRVGGVADLVVLGGDPLRDSSVLRRPVMVLKEGRIAMDRRQEGGGKPRSQTP